jgi:hypothetical protein
LFRWRSELQKHSAAEHGLKILEMKTCSLCHKEIVARRLNEHVKQAVLGIRNRNRIRRILMFFGLPDPDLDPSLSHKCVERTEIMPAK